MATNYPGSLDNFTNPTSASPINSPSHADQHSNANDAIEAIEGELGTNPKGAKATVKARLDDVDTAITLKAPIASPTFTGTVTIPAGSAITGVPYLATANTFTSNQIINNSSSTTPVIVTRNATGQTANIAEFKNESGVSVARISTGGSYFSPSVLTAGSYSTTLGTITSIINSASTIGLVIRGAASQTANLQEWQASDGTVYGRFNAFGSLYVSNNTEGGTAQFGNTGFASASSVVLKVKGSASQTANLQEWQNSAGTVLAKVDASGNATLANVTLGLLVSGSDYRGSYGIGGGGLTTSHGAFAMQSWSTTIVTGVLRAAASQTADLQQWQDSAGTVLTKVNAYGRMTINSTVDAGGAALYVFQPNGGYGVRVLGAGTSGAALWVDTVAGGVGQVIRGAASQTADLQQWQDSAGTSLVSIASDGTIRGGGSFLVDGTYGITNIRASTLGGSLNVGTGYSAQQGIIVRGAASQTANLQEWQNSSGTVLASISPAGKLTSAVDASINGLKIGLGSASISSNLAFGANSLNGNTTGNNNIAIGGASLFSNTTGSSNTAIGSAALYANTVGGGNMAIGFEALNQNIDGNYNTAIGSQSLRNSNTANYNVSIGLQSMYYNTSGASNTSIGSVALLSNTSGNANIAIGYGALYSNTSGYNNTAIGANAGYSNVTGIQNVFIGSSAGYNETGSNKLYIANTNTATPLIGGDFSAKTLTIAGNASIISQNASSIGLLVKAAVSQTSSIIQWQDSSGTTIGEINNQGIFRNTYNYVQNLQGLGGGSGLYLNDVTTTAFNANPAHLVFKVQGFASQTANLQEWQDSAGTVLNSITSDGTFKFKNSVWHKSMTDGQDRFYYEPYSSSFYKSANAHYFRNSTDTTFLTINNVGNVLVNGFTASTVGLTVKGAASQTANLQQWQNSSGTALVSINADGSSNFNNIMQVKETWGGVALSVSALLGQSNPVQGWYTIDSNGDNKTEIAKIDINGQLAVKSVIGNTSSTISANTATTVDTVALSSFTTTEYTISIKQGSKVRSSKVLVHTDGTSVDSTEYGIIEMGGGITGILVTASVSSTNSILQVTITDAATTNATVKLIKTML